MKYILSVFLLVFGAIFSVNGQSSYEIRSYLPEVSGWQLSAETEVFNPDNLFDRINGAAPLFIENNFVEMTSLEYTKSDDYITIQAYRHATPEDAFGMYASERSSDLAFLPIGGEGQGDGKSVYFFSGPVYVKMWTNSSDDLSLVLQDIAVKLADGIDSDATYPVVVRAFPPENMEPYSIAYITANYIGHEFLTSVYTAKYQLQGETIQAFIIDGQTTEGAKEVLNKYFTFTKQPLEFGEGELLIKDRYNGDIPLIWKGEYVIGLFNENGSPVEGGELLSQIAAVL